MPPPLPFFVGRTIDALERDGLLQVRPRPGHAFSSPRGTQVLFLEAKRIVAVASEDAELDGWAQIVFSGDLRRTSYGESAVLGPIDPDDADALVAALTARYGLPRAPRPCAIRELLLDAGHARAGELIVTTGTYQPGHFECSDFDGIKIRGDQARRAALVPGQRFVVTGFVDPGKRPGAMPHPGYNGVGLHAMTIAKEVLPRAPHPTWEGPPGPRRASHAGITFSSALARGGRGQEHADYFSARSGEFCVAALFRGIAGYCGDVGADVCRWALSDLLGETSYGPPLARTELEPPLDVRSHHAHWTSYLLERAPLPGAPDALVDALGGRLHDLFQRLNERAPFAHAEGVLACISANRVRLLRRGIARVYLVRDGDASLVVREHSLAHEILAAGMSPDEVPHANEIGVSCFGTGAPSEPVDLALRAGDRLVILTIDALQAADDARLNAAVAEPTLATLVATLSEKAAEREKGWAVVALDVAS